MSVLTLHHYIETNKDDDTVFNKKKIHLSIKHIADKKTGGEKYELEPSTYTTVKNIVRASRWSNYFSVQVQVLFDTQVPTVVVYFYYEY